MSATNIFVRFPKNEQFFVCTHSRTKAIVSEHDLCLQAVGQCLFSGLHQTLFEIMLVIGRIF